MKALINPGQTLPYQFLQKLFLMGKCNWTLSSMWQKSDLLIRFISCFVISPPLQIKKISRLKISYAKPPLPSALVAQQLHVFKSQHRASRVGFSCSLPIFTVDFQRKELFIYWTCWNLYLWDLNWVTCKMKADYLSLVCSQINIFIYQTSAVTGWFPGDQGVLLRVKIQE